LESTPGYFASMMLGLAAIATNKLLVGTERRMVGFRCRVNQFEIIPELVVHALRAVANNVQTAALFRPAKPERRDYDVATGLNTSLHGLDIRCPVRLVSEKVKDGPIAWF
jgi:hypothetical protein